MMLNFGQVSLYYCTATNWINVKSLNGKNEQAELHSSYTVSLAILEKKQFKYLYAQQKQKNMV